jgi:hypothetical protein
MRMVVCEQFKIVIFRPRSHRCSVADTQKTFPFNIALGEYKFGFWNYMTLYMVLESDGKVRILANNSISFAHSQLSSVYLRKYFPLE